MKMNISDVRIRIAKSDNNKIKASASFTIDNCFAVHDIKIIEGSDGLFIAMPSRKIPDGGFKDIVHPLDSETRNELKELILEAYKQEKANENK